MTDTLKSLRVSLGYTQKDLADKLGVNTVTVSQWERKKFKPTPSIVPKLAKTLGISPKELFFIVNNK